MKEVHVEELLRGVPMGLPRRRGVSTIIAAIFILAVLVTFIVSFTLIMGRLAGVVSRVARSNEEVIKRANEDLEFYGITVYSDGIDLAVVNKGDSPVIVCGYVLRNDSLLEYGTLNPPTYVPPMREAHIFIPSSKPLSPNSQYVITLVSRDGASFKTSYPPPPAPATTAAPSTTALQASLLNTYLPGTAEDGTVTWEGIAPIPAKEVRGGNVTSYNVTSGTQVAPAKPYYLNLSDGEEVNVTAEETVVRVGRAAVFWSDFNTNPFTSGALKPLNTTAEWLWVPSGYVEQLNDQDGEFIALAHLTRPINPSTDTIYVLMEANISAAGAPDVRADAIYDGPGGFYTQGASTAPRPGVPPGSVASVEIWLRSAGAWTQLYPPAGPAPPPPPLPPGTQVPGLNQWFWVLSEHEPDGSMYVTLYNSQGVAISTGNVLDTTVSPTSIGIGTYYSTAAFDDVVITVNASPAYVTVENTPPYATVALYDSAGNLVAEATASAQGVATLNVLTDPIVRDGNITVYTATGAKYASAVFPAVVGGDTYAVEYAVSVTDEAVVSLSGSSAVVSMDVGAAAQANVSAVNYTIYAYDWATGGYVEVGSGSGSLSINVSGLPPQLINQSNGTALLRLSEYSSQPFNVSIDELNAFPTVAVPTLEPALMVGEGGSHYIAVLTLKAGAEGVTASLWGVIDAHSEFNGYADIAFDNYSTDYLYLINTTGIYNTTLLNPSTWTLVTSALHSTGAGVRLEVLHNPSTGSTVLTVMPGEGNDTIYVYNVSDGSILARPYGGLGLNASTPYAVSASNGTTLFTILQNTSSTAATLLEYDPFTNTVFIPPSNSSNAMPGLYSVGLAYGGESLWLILNGGSLYRVDPTYGTFTHLNTEYLPAPLGPGDRLEYFDNYLILVRGSGTSEVWVVPLPP